jgi:hypothetical protein
MVTRLLWLVVTRCGFDDRIASMVLWRQQGPVKDTVHTAPGCTGSFHGSFLCPSQLHREELLMRSSPGSSLPEHVASTYGNVRGAFTCWLAKLTAARARGADPRHSRLHRRVPPTRQPAAPAPESSVASAEPVIKHHLATEGSCDARNRILIALPFFTLR